MSVTINGTSGLVFNDASTQNTAATGFGFKNRIINGAMVISQRNGTTAVSCTNLASTFGVDRFSVYRDNASAVVTLGQSTNAPTGFVNSSIFSVTTGSAPSAANECQFRHLIEGFNSADFGFGAIGASTVTLSFWVRSSLTGTFAVAFQNSGSSSSYVTTYTITAANTWEQKTVSFTGPSTGTWVTNNGTGLVCIWDLGGGSNFNATTNTWTAGNVYTTAGTTKVIGTTGATWQITGVQLEKGSTATSFDYRPYGTELNLCQRYYYKAITGTPFNQLAFCNVRTTTSHYAFMQLPVTMRANPSSIDYSTVGIIAAWGAGVTGLNSLTFADSNYGTGQTQVLLNAVTSSAVGTVGQVSMLLGSASSTAFVALNAEL